MSFSVLQERIKKTYQILNQSLSPVSFRKQWFMDCCQQPIKGMVVVCEAYGVLERPFGWLMLVQNDREFLDIKADFQQSGVQTHFTLAQAQSLPDDFWEEDCPGYFVELNNLDQIVF